MIPVAVTRGRGPVILAQPHGGTWLPDAIAARLNRTGRALADTDWHIHRLYDGLLPGASVVQAQFHRYLIDANRDPGGASLYPGQNTTGLCPLTDFDGRPIWRAGQAPGADEVAARLHGYHAPYHAALAAEIARIKARFGYAVLYDCHSIRSQIPHLFAGRLPDFNIGNNDGASCAARLQAAVVSVAGRYDHVENGRFKGGWTTRHYGQPAAGIHALQMELAQATYLRAEAAPWEYDPAKADQLRRVLSNILTALTTTAQEILP